MKKILYFAVLALIVSACGTPAEVITRGQQYAEMYKQRPVSLLVMPPINNTSNVEAKDLLYTSISRPLIEAGYYVVSPLLAMDILKAESAYDAEMFVNVPLTMFQNYFGCDAVVFSEINKWTKKGFGIEANIRYFIKAAKTGEIIFDRSCDLYLDLEFRSGGNSALSALIDLAASAINTASTEHIVAARKANYFIFNDIPRGKYSPMFGQDQDVEAGEKNITATVR